MTNSTARTNDTTSEEDWRRALPTMAGRRVMLRELRRSDAEGLYRIAADPAVARFILSAPPSVQAMERFIELTWVERSAGRYAGFAIVSAGDRRLAGFIELRSQEPGFKRGEIGAFLDPSRWGRGFFAEAVDLLRDFAEQALRADRLEGRVSIENLRGNAAMHKLGARLEGRLHQAFVRDGHRADQYLWALLNRIDHPQRDTTESTAGAR
jgi:[ribosomal protein S5]-alanine N-acetyltransferase